MNKTLCLLLVLAVLCQAVLAGKSKEKSKEKSNESKSNESKSNESKSKEDSDESSSQEASSTTAGTTEEESTTEATAEATTEPATEPATELATEDVTIGPEPTQTELKGMCKGVIIDMKKHPGNCNKFVICVLGKPTIQSCGKNQVFYSDIKVCAFGDPKKC